MTQCALLYESLEKRLTKEMRIIQKVRMEKVTLNQKILVQDQKIQEKKLVK